MNTYITCHDYVRAPTGVESASLIGNMGRLTSSVAIGATALLVPATTVALAQYDQVTVFDGSSSEVLTVTSATPANSTSIPVGATAYAHAAGTSYCSDGAQGSLAWGIINCAAWMENVFTYQSLFQSAYTGEVIRLPSMRASVDSQHMLALRPRHFPVTALSGMTIKANQAAVTSYDASQAIIDASQQVVIVPWLTSTTGGGSTYSLYTVVSRQSNLWLTISYTAGYLASAMPQDVREAATLLTSDILSRRQNPTGAAEIRMGKRQLSVGVRGDLSGESVLVKRARDILSNYSTETN